MSAENQLNPADKAIETVYTTIESQPDRTDWLTVVSNLRQINRQLVEQIARLEQALASAKQSMHTYKEEKQTHEITILQQQDELRLAQDRVGALFQQLETSHQIGQRQQTLIETISQQLEITQAIVPQLEAENTELQQKIQQQQQKLAKTEQVALELHRRMKHKASAPEIELQLPPTVINDSAVTVTPSILETLPTATPETTAGTGEDRFELEAMPIDNSQSMLLPSESATESTTSAPDLDRPELVTATLETSSDLPKSATAEMPVWTPTPPTNPARSVNWREAIESTKNPQGSDALTADSATSGREALPLVKSHENRFPSPTLTSTPAAEVVNKESTAPNESPTPKPSPNWPAPTLDRRTVTDSNSDLTGQKKVIDLPKFPKNKK